MWILCNLCLVVSLAVSTFGQNDVRKPPSITKDPETEVIFRENKTVTLTCKAEGTPPLTYMWKRNGEDLNVNLLRRGSDGDITIVKATLKDEGFYQCLATNQYGTALSTVAQIQMAFLGKASQSDPVNMTVQEGRPFVIPAARRDSFPTPTYSWEIKTGDFDPQPRTFYQSQRVHIACNGDLYFAYAEKADELGGSIYKSTVFNAVTDERSGGSYTRIIVTQGSGDPPDFPPNITYFSKSHDVAVIGRDIELKCFFSGKPLPEIAWSGPRNNLPVGRSSIHSEHHKTHLIVSNISESDEGDYVCTANNTLGRIQHTLNIRVEAVPIFKRESDGPRNVNVTEGDSITFNCSASAKPEATVVWLRNGQPIDVKKGPKGFVFSDDGKSLTIRDVCRDCNDREKPTDLAVIQCNASNVHGYAFASGYLNVLLRTKVTLQLSSTFVSVDLTKENRFQFVCSAQSDPSTPPTVQWYKVGHQGLELVYNEPPYVYVMQGNLTINTEPNCSTTCHKYFGEYMCIGDNGYTQDTANVILKGTTEPTFEPPAPASVNWIVVGIAVVFFVLLLLLICYIMCRLRKGDEYDIDGKERKSGRNPEKEIQENDFKDYYPSEYDKRKGSPASLGSDDMFKGLDDINEYDDDDENFVGKFSKRPLYD